MHQYYPRQKLSVCPSLLPCKQEPPLQKSGLRDRHHLCKWWFYKRLISRRMLLAILWGQWLIYEIHINNPQPCTSWAHQTPADRAELTKTCVSQAGKGMDTPRAETFITPTLRSLLPTSTRLKPAGKTPPLLQLRVGCVTHLPPQHHHVCLLRRFCNVQFNIWCLSQQNKEADYLARLALGESVLTRININVCNIEEKKPLICCCCAEQLPGESPSHLLPTFLEDASHPMTQKG